MSERAGGDGVRVTVTLEAAEHDALAAAAARCGLPAAELARALVLWGLGRLERGDAELLRAVKGSRDAGVR